MCAQMGVRHHTKHTQTVRVRLQPLQLHPCLFHNAKYSGDTARLELRLSPVIPSLIAKARSRFDGGLWL